MPPTRGIRYKQVLIKMRKIFFVSLAIVVTTFLIPITTDAAQTRCPYCRGKGYTEKRIVIPHYGGISPDSKGGDYWVKEDCWRCNGTGRIELRPYARGALR